MNEPILTFEGPPYFPLRALLSSMEPSRPMSFAEYSLTVQTQALMACHPARIQWFNQEVVRLGQLAGLSLSGDPASVLILLGFLEVSPESLQHLCEVQLIPFLEARIIARSTFPTIPSVSVHAKQPKSARISRPKSGDSRDKLIAALTLHHKYENGSCLNFEPIGNNKLAKAAQVSASTASAFFQKEFGGYSKYRFSCRDKQNLVGCMKLLNGEVSPRHLLGNSAEKVPAPQDDNKD
jgi:hypothetical protein